jgi:hypothetical protein
MKSQVECAGGGLDNLLMSMVSFPMVNGLVLFRLLREVNSRPCSPLLRCQRMAATAAHTRVNRYIYLLTFASVWDPVEPGFAESGNLYWILIRPDALTTGTGICSFKHFPIITFQITIKKTLNSLSLLSITNIFALVPVFKIWGSGSGLFQRADPDPVKVYRMRPNF